MIQSTSSSDSFGSAFFGEIREISDSNPAVVCGLGITNFALFIIGCLAVAERIPPTVTGGCIVTLGLSRLSLGIVYAVRTEDKIMAKCLVIFGLIAAASGACALKGLVSATIVGGVVGILPIVFEAITLACHARLPWCGIR